MRRHGLVGCVLLVVLLVGLSCGAAEAVNLGTYQWGDPALIVEKPALDWHYVDAEGGLRDVSLVSPNEVEVTLDGTHGAGFYYIEVPLGFEVTGAPYDNAELYAFVEGQFTGQGSGYMGLFAFPDSHPYHGLHGAPLLADAPPPLCFALHAVEDVAQHFPGRLIYPGFTFGLHGSAAAGEVQTATLRIDRVGVSSVPEPGSIALLAGGLPLVLAIAKTRRRELL